MAKDLLDRYLWLIETIRRHKYVSRRKLDELWKRSALSGGESLCRRTLYNYRNAISQVFRINIQCDPSTHEYYIEEEEETGGTRTQLVDWMISSAQMSNVLAGMQDISDRVFLEEVPSARQYLSTMVDALKGYHQVTFDYHPYTRSLPTRDVCVEPYFLKIFRQRWYLTGYNPADRKIKTYALDRMSQVRVSTESFTIPAGFDSAEYVRDAFGIVFAEGLVHKVVIRADNRRAKYLRALPLHPSQEESVHDAFSIFTYRLRVTPDLVQELLSYGPDITVLEPPALRAMIIESLSRSMQNYSSSPNQLSSSPISEKK